MNTSLILLCGILLLRLSVQAAAPDPFAENVRSTEPLTPEQELQSFHLPPGFIIQLVAAEPQIAKPMNLAFDSKGRLWVTVSREYPFAAPLNQNGRDAVKILQDTNGDGSADHVVTFAEGLNIPMGLYPTHGGAIVFSIPYIYRFYDRDSDDRSDHREILYGPLGWEKDTHGLNNAFRRGFDGWLYACHGFNNDTVIEAKDGSRIQMNSGNTYRIRIDGSRVEQFTWGQVNPFGMCFDPQGNVYTADCHSAPIYQLIRGAYYPSFGKPHDGLGFAPAMMHHSHGSTAIGGIVLYSDNNWPSQFRNNVFVGNVMTSRVNRDALIWSGSTPTAKELPDLIRSDDPWFRPVDLQWGPDGALYVADFYNRIIGHYEVPLEHPGRDRERGRIWRIVYVGGTNSGSRLNIPPDRTNGPQDLSTASTAELIVALASPNLTRRMLASDQLSDRVGASAVPALEKLLRNPQAPSFQKIHGLWVLHRLKQLPLELIEAAAGASDRDLRTHAMRVLGETAAWTDRHAKLALDGLADTAPLVQRAAAEALGQHPAFEHIAPLLAQFRRAHSADTHLRHTLRLSLRNQLRPEENLARLDSTGLSPDDVEIISGVALAIPAPGAASFLLQHLQTRRVDGEILTGALRHIARYIPESKSAHLAALVRQTYKADLDLQLLLFQSVQEGATQRGNPLTPAARAWGAELAQGLLRSVDGPSLGWRNYPVEQAKDSRNPWFLQKRPSADGNRDALFLCSLPPGGEHLTGLLRSTPFIVPDQLSFFIAGHDGVPGKPPQNNNFARLRALETGRVLAETPAPRNDLAQPVSWDLKAFTDKIAYLEIVDGDPGEAYAWIAVGRLEPPVVSLPSIDPRRVSFRQKSAAELAQELLLTDLEPELTELLVQNESDLEAQAAAAKALIALNPNDRLAPLSALLGDRLLPPALRKSASRALVARNETAAELIFQETLRTTPYRVQLSLARYLAGNPTGSAKLVEWIENGQASPRLLLDRLVKEKLLAAAPRHLLPRLEKLTPSSAPSQEIQKRIDQTRARYLTVQSSVAEGERVFARHCSACHQIGGKGGLVGPQLDGIGNRGLERIAEDLLDPSRNVDQAFRVQLLVLKNGDVLSGLPRREEGQLLVIADSTGKELSVPLADIQQRRPSELSLMPENLSEILSAEELNHLLLFLLSQRTE